MTDDRSQQKDQGLSNLSVDPDLLARELAAEDDVDPLDAIQLDDAEQDSSLQIARSCDQASGTRSTLTRRLHGSSLAITRVPVIRDVTLKSLLNFVYNLPSRHYGVGVH